MATATRPYLTMVKGKPKMFEYTPASAVTAGDVFVTNGQPCIAHADIAASAMGAVAVEGGIYSGMADGAISVGNRVFWDNTNFKFTLTASGNSHFGFCVAGPTADMVGAGPAADGDTCYAVHSPEGQRRSASTLDPIGYGVGAGGSVTQATSKSTGVTLSKLSGKITMHAANLATLTAVTFTWTNTLIEATDTILFSVSGGQATGGSYFVSAVPAAGSAAVSLVNLTAGTLGEAVVLNFAVIKAPIT